MIRLRESEFEDIVRYIRENYGINLDKKQVLIECRLSRELEKRGIDSYGKYLEYGGRDDQPPDDELYIFHEGAQPFFHFKG